MWQFPLLATYKLFDRRVAPVVELGPSFRTPQEIYGSKLSVVGITAGAGVAARMGRVRISPACGTLIGVRNRFPARARPCVIRSRWWLGFRMTDIYNHTDVSGDIVQIYALLAEGRIENRRCTPIPRIRRAAGSTLLRPVGPPVSPSISAKARSSR